MLQQDVADSYILATGETRSVREMVNYVFERVNLDVNRYVDTAQKHHRPEELHYLRGDSTKARTILGWTPKITFNNMMDEMVDYWLDKLKNKA